ncbi:TPA: hypothetical protein HA251_02605 [Candidatus Woesearchaeota archaeon]|nr:hypothetical protein [Candidatus Woesearchaeota archaeon]
MTTKHKSDKKDERSTEAPQQGPTPLTILLIIIGCILLLGMLSAAAKVFLLPALRP